jgi:hypothetical protein
MKRAEVQFGIFSVSPKGSFGRVDYEVVFDCAEAGYRNWRFPAYGLIPVGIGIWMLVRDRRLARQQPGVARARPWRAYYITVFGSLWVTIAFIGTFRDYWLLSAALRSGNYEVVEGTVTRFTPMTKGGPAKESFFVNGHYYEYSDWGVSAGFNNMEARGGPIRQGLRVRIADVGGEIARLEIAK